MLHKLSRARDRRRDYFPSLVATLINNAHFTEKMTHGEMLEGLYGRSVTVTSEPAIDPDLGAVCDWQTLRESMKEQEDGG